MELKTWVFAAFYTLHCLGCLCNYMVVFWHCFGAVITNLRCWILRDYWKCWAADLRDCGCICAVAAGYNLTLVTSWTLLLMVNPFCLNWWSCFGVSGHIVGSIWAENWSWVCSCSFPPAAPGFASYVDRVGWTYCPWTSSRELEIHWWGADPVCTLQGLPMPMVLPQLWSCFVRDEYKWVGCLWIT